MRGGSPAQSPGAACLAADSAGHQGGLISAGLVDVEIHAVNTLDFQGHLLADDFGIVTVRATLMDGSGRHGSLRAHQPQSGFIGDASSIPRF